MFSFLFYIILHNPLNLSRVEKHQSWIGTCCFHCSQSRCASYPAPSQSQPFTWKTQVHLSPSTSGILLLRVYLLLTNLPYAQLLVTFKQPLYYSAFCHFWQSMDWMNYFCWPLQLVWPDMLLSMWITCYPFTLTFKVRIDHCDVHMLW